MTGETDLTPADFRVLEALKDGPLYNGSLGARADVSWRSKIFPRLVRSGLISKCADTRAGHFEITESGLAMLATRNPPRIREMSDVEKRTDFENLNDGDRVTLFPNEENPLHKKPVLATFQSGYFYCDGSNHADGPDYYFGDVLRYNDGFSVVQP